MSADSQRTIFRSAQEVVDYFRQEVTINGTPHLAGIEEEIIVVDCNGKPTNHCDFQNFLGDLISALPGGKTISGRTINGNLLPVLKGEFAGGFVQPETNTTLVEYAHAPTEHTWGCYRQSRDFTSQLMKIAASHNLSVIGGGVVPTVCWDDFLKNDVVIPNADFTYSWKHMTEGTRNEYCRTVFGTASVHHNMGFNDPELMARYITTVLRIQPSMIALLGNSPIWDNERSIADGIPLLSHRSRVQIDYGKIFGECDGVSYLYPDFLINSDGDFASIVEGYLDLPLDRTMIDGKKVECKGLTMRAYLNGYERDGIVHYPDAGALIMMVREPIVDVRPSFIGTAPRVEARAHDAVSQHIAVAIDAFYRGILANLDQAQDLMAGFSNEDIRRSRHKVCENGMATLLVHPRNDIKTQQDLLLQLLNIAENGLIMRGHSEEILLAPLFVLAETGFNPAERLLSVYDKSNKDIGALLRAVDYSQHGFADGMSYAWPTQAPRVSQPVNARGKICVLSS